MAIEIKRMVVGPPYPEEIPPAPLEISVESARIILRERVRAYAEQIPQNPIKRAIRFMQSAHLIDIDSNQGWMSSTEPGHPGYLLDQSKLQEMALDVMGEFGLDTNVRDQLGHSLTEHSNGTIRERTVFPSQAVTGLQFVRWHDYIDTTGAPVSVSWKLEYNHKLFIKPSATKSAAA